MPDENETNNVPHVEHSTVQGKVEMTPHWAETCVSDVGKVHSWVPRRVQECNNRDVPQTRRSRLAGLCSL
jgi:hypothetical protein